MARAASSAPADADAAVSDEWPDEKSVLWMERFRWGHTLLCLFPPALLFFRPSYLRSCSHHVSFFSMPTVVRVMLFSMPTVVCVMLLFCVAAYSFQTPLFMLRM